MTDKVTEAMLAGTMSVTSRAGHSVRFDFETRDEADIFAEAMLAMQFASPRPTGDVVKTIQRALRRFVSEQDEATWQLPTIQFISNRDDLIAEAIVAALATLQPADPVEPKVSSDVEAVARAIEAALCEDGERSVGSIWANARSREQMMISATAAIATLRASDPSRELVEALSNQLDLIDELYRKYGVELDAQDVATAQSGRAALAQGQSR